MFFHSLTSAEFAKYPLVICGLRANEKEELDRLYPNYMQTIWNNKIGLQPVVKGTRVTEPLSFAPLRTIREINEGVAISGVPAPGSAIVFYASTASLVNNKLKDNTLYNVVIKGEGDYWSVASPHCIYIKQSWVDFAAIHATDLHVSQRLDMFRKILKDKGQEEGVANYNNFNDAFRDLIVYANKLHTLGALDMLILTGDLVDYIFEESDDRNGVGNFKLFKKIILGESPYPDKEFYVPNENKIHEELMVPVYTTLGNHDYRPNAYDLISKLDAGDYGLIDISPGGWKNEWLANYSSMNLTRKEATVIMGKDHEYYTMQEAANKVAAVKDVPQFNFINFTNNYVVKLGNNRLVMLDTEMDNGILDSSAKDVLRIIAGSLNESEQNFVASNPDSVGCNDEKLGILKRSLQSSSEGVVIVGMHAPPINTKNNEFAHYFRETEHPEVDKSLINGYLNRCDFLRFSSLGGATDPDRPFSDWLRTESLNFKRKSPSEFLDYGVSLGKQEEFLKLCAGQDSTRKVNLVLCGHGHKRVEYRLGWNEESKHLRYYMDFYTDNPQEYYKSKYNEKVSVINNLSIVNKIRNVRIFTNPSSKVNEAINTVIDHRESFTPWQKNYSLSVPTYKNPLNKSTNPIQWWKEHSPIIVQTAALGPIESNNRKNADENPEMPNPTFNGFRYIKIDGNVISKIYYVTLGELRKNGFKMPWEPRVFNTIHDISGSRLDTLGVNK